MNFAIVKLSAMRYCPDFCRGMCGCEMMKLSGPIVYFLMPEQPIDLENPVSVLSFLEAV